MTKKDVAARAHVSLPTVNRILAGKQDNPSCATLSAIAKALGVVVRLGDDSTVEETQPAYEYSHQEARRKAERLVRMVQGTMALESQGVDQTHLEYLIDRATGELLRSHRKLWGE